MTQAQKRLDTDAMLRDGQFDATALLLLWCMRKAFLPLLWIGLTVAVLTKRDDASLGDALEAEIEGLDSASEFWAALLSPFSGVLIALALRVVVGLFGFALAYPITRWNRPSDYARRGKVGSYVRLWWDRVYLVRAYRSLRWSWAVRQAAADRLGRRGQILESCNPFLTFANLGFLVIFVVVLAVLG